MTARDAFAAARAAQERGAQERTVRDAMVAATEADIDRMLAPVARAVAASVRRHGKEGMTPFVRALVLRDVDAALAPVYGRAPGDPSAGLLKLVAKRSNQAWALALQRSADLARRRLPADLIRVVDEASQ